MLRHYKFDHINESSSDNYDLQEAIDAVKKKGIFDEIDEKKSEIQSGSNWPVAVIYSTNNKKDIYNNNIENNIAIYSFNKGDVITDYPIVKFNKHNGYAEVEISIDNGKYFVDNILNDNGFVFDEEVYLNSITKDRFIVEGDGWQNITDKNGNLLFDDNKDSIKELDNGAIFVEDFKKDTGYLYDEDLNLKIKNVKDVEYILVNFEECGGDYEDFYITSSYDLSRGYYDPEESLYNKDFKKIATNIKGYDVLTENGGDAYIVEITGHDDKKNILYPGGKLLFGDGNINNQDDWYDELTENPNDNDDIIMIERDEKYVFFNTKSFKFELDGTWFDDVHMLESDTLDEEGVICVMIGNECNMIYRKKWSDKLEYLLDENVDDIKIYDDFDFVIVTKNNHDYLLWKNNKFIAEEFDKIYKIDDYDAYTIIINGKFDFISTDEDQTFCEKYMNGNKFDKCFDIKSYYPVVEYNGKYSYVDIESFRPLFGHYHNDNMTWFDHAEPAEYIDNEFIFPVIVNGQKQRLDTYENNIDDPDY
jgi:hypothetical protein